LYPPSGERFPLSPLCNKSEASYGFPASSGLPLLKGDERGIYKGRGGFEGDGEELGVRAVA